MSEALHISRGDRINSTQHNNWDSFGRFFGGPDHHVINCQNDIDFLLYKLIHKPRHPIQPALCIAAFDQDVFLLHVTKIAQAQPECVEQG